MKIKSSLLKKAVSVAKSALPARAAEPKFDAIWFTGAPESLCVSGSNPDGTYHEAVVDCVDGGLDLEFALPSAIAASAVASMPQDEEIEVFLEKGKCVFKNSIGEMRVATLNVDRSPENKNRRPLLFECPRQSLVKAMQACKFSETSVNGTSIDKTSISTRGGFAFLFSRTNSSGSLAELCQCDNESVKVFFELSRFRKSLGACDGEAISFFADERSVRMESDSDGISTSVEFMQCASHKIAVDPIASMDVSADANVVDVGLLKSAFAQASVLKLPEHCSVVVVFGKKQLLIRSGTSNGSSEFLVPVVSDSEREVLARIEHMQECLAICSSGGGLVRIAVLSSDGEDKMIMFENESKTIRLFSATMER